MRNRLQGSRRVLVAAVLALGVVVAAGALSGSQAGPGDSEHEHGYLGVYMQTLTKELKKGLELDVRDGVLISGVEDDSPAAKAGLEDGDVVVEFDGKAVNSPDELREFVGETEPGTTVSIVLIRDGDRKTIDLTVGERPDEFRFFGMRGDGDSNWFFSGDDDWFGEGVRPHIAALMGGPVLGVQVTDMDEDLADYFDAKNGLLVLSVNDESLAASAGVKSGDVIQSVNGDAVEDASDIRAALEDLDEDDQFEIVVLRKGKTRKLDATMDDQKGMHFWSNDAGHRIRIDRAPHVKVHEFESQMREELEELKQEMKALKKELREKLQ